MKSAWKDWWPLARRRDNTSAGSLSTRAGLRPLTALLLAAPSQADTQGRTRDPDRSTWCVGDGGLNEPATAPLQGVAAMVAGPWSRGDSVAPQKLPGAAQSWDLTWTVQGLVKLR